MIAIKFPGTVQNRSFSLVGTYQRSLVSFCRDSKASWIGRRRARFSKPHTSRQHCVTIKTQMPEENLVLPKMLLQYLGWKPSFLEVH